jgi:hypothetical protein
MKDKLAEEILKTSCAENRVFLTSNEWHTIIEAMQAYHEAKMKEVTDADIVKYAFNCYSDSYNMRVACVNGARDMRNGEIKHVSRENDC